MSLNIGSVGASDYTQYRNLFAKIDTDGDGKVTRDKFVSGAPEGVGGDVATTLFNALDSQQSGALSESDLASAFEQLSSVARSLLIQLQTSEPGSTERQASGGGPGARLFAKLDADADGTVTRDEFVAGRPDGVSEERAGELFDTIAGDDAEGLTQQQLVDGLLSQLHARSQGHRPDPKALFATLDADGDGTVTRDEFVAGRPEDVSEEQAGAFFDEIAGDSQGGLTEDAFLAGFQAQGPGSSGGPQGRRPDPAEIFSTLDVNQDGVVSRDEFLAGRPNEVSEEQAGAFYDKLAADNPDGLSREAFTQGFQRQRAEEPAASSAAATVTDMGQLVDQLLAALRSGEADSGAGGNAASQPLDLFLRAIAAYRNAASTAAA